MKNKLTPMRIRVSAMRDLKLILAALTLAMIVFSGGLASGTDSDEAIVEVASIKGMINTLTALYLDRAIKSAEKHGATAVLIELDTPGGEVEAMREIVKKMFASPMPVIVFVFPPGARAGSAGVFLTLAGDIAAMSPGTNIGAAHPVASGGQNIEGELGKKITNDLAAFIRTIAEKRGRNQDWAERAVRESVSITEKEALELKVIDLIAKDINELLAKADGRLLSVDRGGKRLNVQPASIKRTAMNPQEKLIHFIVNPNIAYLLLTIGILAVMAELYNPGALAPGLVGAIFIILFFIASSVLPLNWGGLALIILATVMFILELKVTSYGMLTIGGIVIFILGSAMLFRNLTPETPLMPSLSVNPWLIASLTAAASVFFFFAIRAITAAQRKKSRALESMLIGEAGIATSRVGPIGTVHVHGELWTAQAEEGEIAEGEKIVVVGVDGLKLRVKRVTEEERRTT